MSRTKFRFAVGTSQRGYSLVELLIVSAILLIVLAPIFGSIEQLTKRSQAEGVKVDLSQQAREFVDQFERDVHQAGYPNCRMFTTGSNCPAQYNNAAIAVGLVSVSNTQIVFEGDVDGDGTVDTVWYRLVDSAGNYPPTGSCPCTIQRSQMAKVNGTAPLSQPTTFSQELQNVVNSGVPGGTAVYGGGLPIAGNTDWGESNTAYYAAVTTFKDFPVFTAYDQSGNVIPLPQDITTPAGQQTLPTIRSIRLTLNLLANQVTGTDMDTRTRPVETLVGDGRLVNDTF
jgi:prepilin-type N-terminal cleavage/methylation domain-containing protein